MNYTHFYRSGDKLSRKMLVLNELFKVLSEKAVFFFFPNRTILFINGESKKMQLHPISL